MVILKYPNTPTLIQTYSKTYPKCRIMMLYICVGYYQYHTQSLNKQEWSDKKDNFAFD